MPTDLLVPHPPSSLDAAPTLLTKPAAAQALAAHHINANPMNSSAVNLNTLAGALLSQNTLALAATAVCNELAQQLGGHRVSIGWCDSKSIATRCNILAQSSVDTIKLSADAQGQLADAMFESLDQADTAIYDAQFTLTSTATATSTISTAQAQLATLRTPIVLSTILAINQRLVGAITIEITASHADQFRQRWPAIQASIPHLSEMLAAGLQLHSDAQGNLLKRFNNLRFKPNARWTLAAIVLISLAMLFIPVNNPVSASARLEGLAQRSVGAPSAGILKTVLVRPGDNVIAGQVIAQLSERDFELEKTRLQSELLQAQGGYSSAMAKGDRTTMMVAQAKSEEIVSQLGLIDHQLEQIQLRAPIDGVLIHGDLQPLTGTPVDKGQSLFVIAPKQKFRVIAELEERDLRRVQIGQKGRVTLSALPWQQWEVVVQRVAPAATAIDGRGVIEVQAQLIANNDGLTDGRIDELRPGLRGVVQLESGNATLVSIVWDRVRVRWQLFAWRWLPWLGA